MIKLIITSYLTIFLSIGTAALMLLVFGLYFICKPRKKAKNYHSSLSINNNPTNFYQENLIPEKQLPEKNENDSLPWQDILSAPALIREVAPKGITISSNDISAIAGDDVIATQLDLARAYLETGRKQLAKKILEHVITQGSDVQQTEARDLMLLV